MPTSPSSTCRDDDEEEEEDEEPLSASFPSDDDDDEDDDDDDEVKDTEVRPIVPPARADPTPARFEAAARRTIGT